MKESILEKRLTALCRNEEITVLKADPVETVELIKGLLLSTSKHLCIVLTSSSNYNT